MSFLESLHSLFPGDGTFWENRLNAQYTISLDADKLPDFKNIVAFLSNLPERDHIAITVTVDDETFFSFENKKPFDEESWETYLKNSTDEDCSFDIAIKITKTKHLGHCTIYSYNDFIKDLASQSFHELIIFFNTLLLGESSIIFDVLEDGKCWGTEHLAFVSDGASIQLDECRLKTLEACRDNAHFLNFSSCNLLPSDFHIGTNYEGNPLTDKFSKLETFLSIAFISNSFSFDKEGCSTSFSALRDFKEEIHFVDLRFNRHWYKIYEWAYSDAHISDKLALVRNVVSLNCKFKKILDIDETLLASIQSNYLIYLKNNISEYLTARNKIGDYISGVLLNLSEHISNLSTSLTHNFIGVLAFSLTTIFPKLISGNTGIQFSDTSRNIVFFAIAISVIYLIFCVINFNDRILTIRESFAALKDNYTNIFSEVELAQIFDNTTVENRIKRAERRRLQIISIWFFFMLALACGINYFSEHPLSFNFISSSVSFNTCSAPFILIPC